MLTEVQSSSNKSLGSRGEKPRSPLMALYWIIFFTALTLSSVCGKIPKDIRIEPEVDELLSFGRHSYQKRDTSIANCEQGWYTFGDMCYKTFGTGPNERLQWHQAEKQCVSVGGHLATISSQELNEFLVMNLLINVKQNMWIGFNDRVNETNFEWSDKSEVFYTNWRWGEPTSVDGHKTEEDCAEFVLSHKAEELGKWNDADCHHSKPFICQKNKVLGITKYDDPRRCETGGFKLRSTCYFFVREVKTWDEAEDHCSKQYHGNLVAITDFNVQLFLNYLLAQDRTPAMWIGMNLSPGKTVMKWSSGWYLTYQNWQKSLTKDDILHQYCAVRLRTGSWDVVPCQNKFEFICQMSSEIAPKLINTDRTATCPKESEEWVDLGGNFCYIFKPATFLSWYEANFHCTLAGGTLVSFHSNAEHMCIEQFLRFTGYYFHIGFYRDVKSENNTFFWVDGTSVDFTRWGSSEPNSKDEKCGELRIESMDWNDIKCDTSRGYVCSAEKAKYELRNLGSEKEIGDCGSGLSPSAIFGIVICALLVMTLIVVVIYNIIPRDRDQKDTRKSSLTRPPTVQSSTSRYRSGEIIVLEEDDYENSVR